MKTKIFKALLLLVLGAFTAGCQGLESSSASGEPLISDSEQTSDDNPQSEDATETSSPTTEGGGEDNDTETEDSTDEGLGDDPGSDESSCDYEGSEDDWGDQGPVGECFQACEANLEQTLEECDPDGPWEDSSEDSPPPQEDPEDAGSDNDEPEEETDVDVGEPSDEDIACFDEALAIFDACLAECDPEGDWGGSGEDDIDCPEDSPPDCAEDQHVEWFEDDMGCVHPECVENGSGDDNTVGVFECGETACIIWEEYCQTTYPGQPQGPIQYQCLPLPDDCSEEPGYCSCIESVIAGAGMCEEDDGMVYVTIYAP